MTEPVVPHFTKEYHRAPYPSISPTRPELSAAGKTIIITGAAGGIGTAICKAFVDAGAKNLIALDFNQLGLLKLKKQLEDDGSSKIHPIVLDITNTEAVKRTFDNIESAFGKADVLVNNAGYHSQKQPLFELDIDDWYRNFDINVKGSFIVAVEFLRHAKPDAVLINLSSIVAHYGVRRGYSKHGSGYAASKIAITKVMDIIQEEVPNVRIVNMHPGLVATAMAARAGTTEDSGDSGKPCPYYFLPESLFTKAGPVDLPGHFAVWLASPEAEFTKARLVWSNWDVDEMMERKNEIIEKDLLRLELSGIQQ